MDQEPTNEPQKMPEVATPAYIPKPEPTPVPAPTPTPPPAPTPEQPKGKPDPILAGAITVTADGRIELGHEPKPVEHKADPRLKQIRTFEGDVADAIKKQNESLVSIERKESVRAEEQQAMAAPLPPGARTHSTRGVVMILLTIIFIGAGGYGAYYAWTLYQSRKPQAPVVVSAPENQFISASTVTDVDASTLGRESLLSTVAGIRQKVRPSDLVEQLELRYGATPDAGLVTTSDFLFRLSSHAPAPLVRAFDKNFELGLFGYPSHTFILIKLASFENAFPGMLEWEPHLAEDIWPLVTSQSVIDSIPVNPEFEDIVVSNRDARILKDNSGRTVLLYSFYDNAYLLITDNEGTFRTLISRLDSQKLSR